MDERSEGGEGGDGTQFPTSDEETKHWINALVFTGLLLTLLMVVCLYVRMPSSDVDRAYFQRKMSGEHTLMEAFFQSPPLEDFLQSPSEQDAIARAIRACPR